MLKRIIEAYRERAKIKALLLKEGAGVVIADLSLTSTHRPLTRYESRLLSRLYQRRAKVTRLLTLRINELEVKELRCELTAKEALELRELRSFRYD